MREVLAADPEVIEAFTMLGNMHIKAGRPADAIAAYRGRSPSTPSTRARPGAWRSPIAPPARTRKRGRVRARDAADRAAPSRCVSSPDLSMRRGEFAEARRCWRRGRVDADRAAFLVKLGEARIELKQFDAAEKALTEAIAAKGYEAMAHYDLGLVHEARGQWREAATA